MITALSHSDGFLEHDLSIATTARFAMYGNDLPPLEEAVRIGELLREAAISLAGQAFGQDRVPPILSGHGLPRHSRHGHAFFIPEDADGDGHIDHLLVHAVGGLGSESVQTLGHLTRLWSRREQQWQVILEDVGASALLAPVSALCQCATTWGSAVPYLHPWYSKKRFTVEDQIRRECRERGLPEPSALERLETIPVGSRQRRPIDFHRFRSKRGLTQPDRQGSFWRLTFSGPVQGPLALGFGCHFGLGLFKPVTEN